MSQQVGTNSFDRRNVSKSKIHNVFPLLSSPPLRGLEICMDTNSQSLFGSRAHSYEQRREQERTGQSMACLLPY